MTVSAGVEGASENENGISIACSVRSFIFHFKARIAPSLTNGRVGLTPVSVGIFHAFLVTPSAPGRWKVLINRYMA